MCIFFNLIYKKGVFMEKWKKEMLEKKQESSRRNDKN